jgi:hypothetical protein
MYSFSFGAEGPETTVEVLAPTGGTEVLPPLPTPAKAPLTTKIALGVATSVAALAVVGVIVAAVARRKTPGGVSGWGDAKYTAEEHEKLAFDYGLRASQSTGGKQRQLLRKARWHEDQWRRHLRGEKFAGLGDAAAPTERVRAFASAGTTRTRMNCKVEWRLGKSYMTVDQPATASRVKKLIGADTYADWKTAVCKDGHRFFRFFGPRSSWHITGWKVSENGEY